MENRNSNRGGGKRPSGPRKDNFNKSRNNDRTEKRSFDKKPRFGNDSDSPKKFGFKDKKEFGERKEFGAKRSFSNRSENSDRKEFSGKRDFSKSKDFSDKKEYSGKREFSSRNSSSDKREFSGKRDFSGKKSYSEDKEFSSKRTFSDRSERSYKPKSDNDFGKKDFSKPAEFRKGPGRNFNRDDKPKFDDFSFNDSRESKGKSFGKSGFGRTSRDEDRKPVDKAKTIKSKFVSKSRDARNEDNKIKTPDYTEAFKPSRTNRNKRSEEEKKEGIRLNRYIANSGVCSRRDADMLISTGEITVNGNIVTEMGFIVQPMDVVKYAGRTLKREKNVYVLLNKPKDFITTTTDPDDRRTVMDLVSGAAKERLFPVGRLDRNTTGLLLLTNDGELAETLSHPSNQIKKIYQVTLDKPLEESDYEKISRGVYLEDGQANVDDIAIITPDRINIGLEIHIGRNRIVRRIFESLGYDVVKLDRVLYAELTKRDLPRGSWRYLTEKEVISLQNMNRKKKK